MKKQSICCTSIVLLILVVGCAPKANPITVQATVSPLTTNSPISTPTSIPPSTTPTLIPASTQLPPTQTSFPTLTADEAKTKLFNLLLENGGCILPCFLGYSPGISSREDVQNFFREFRVKDTPDLSISRTVATDRSIIGFYIRLTNNYLNIGMSTFENKGRVEVFGMGSFSQPEWELSYAEVMKYYLLPQILINYGKPSEIIILTYRNDRQRPDVTSFPFFLVLLYPNQGFYVKYEMERVTSGTNFLGCPSKSFVDVVVWTPNDDEIFESIVKPTINGEYFSDYKSLSDATSLTIEDFYQGFSNPESQNCLETSIETWPNP